MASIYASAKSEAGYTWQLRLDYTITQDEESNSSKIACDLYLYHGSAGGYNLVANSAYYVICGGSKVYKTYDFRDVDPKWTKLGSRTVTVEHEYDGTKSYTLSASWYSDNETYYTPAKISISKKIDLPRIIRKLAWVNVDGTCLRSVPWINVNGIWRTAIVWVRCVDAWRSFGKAIPVGDTLVSIVNDGIGNANVTFAPSVTVEQNDGNVTIVSDCISQDADGNVAIQ